MFPRKQARRVKHAATSLGQWVSGVGYAAKGPKRRRAGNPRSRDRSWIIAETCPPICIRPDQSFPTDLTIRLRGRDRQKTTQSGRSFFKFRSGSGLRRGTAQAIMTCCFHSALHDDRLDRARSYCWDDRGHSRPRARCGASPSTFCRCA